MTGIEVGRFLRQNLKNEVIQIIYVSAKESYAMQLFDTRPMNFLIKPINYKKIKYILDEYQRLYGFQKRFFQYKIGKTIYEVNEQCILYFQSQGKKIRFITQDKEVEFYGKLSEVSQRLNVQQFCTIHKSYVVNLRYVTLYGKDYMQMVNGEKLPISRSMRQYVSERILGNIVGE